MIAILFCFFIALLIMLLICLAFRVLPGLFGTCEKMITYFCDMISKISGVK